MIAWLSRACACAAALLLGCAVSAHELRPLIASLDVQGTEIELTLSLNLEAAVAGIGPGHERTGESPAAPEYNRLRELDPMALRDALDRIAPAFLANIDLTFDARRVPLRIARATAPEAGDLGLARISEIVLAGTAPAGASTVSWHLAPTLGDSVFRMPMAAGADSRHSAFVRAGESAGPFSLAMPVPASALVVLGDYAQVGFVHIVPRGLDHIAFVIGLFLLSTRLSSLLWQISAFTLAHTLSLALGTLGIVSVPASVVEPLIAASIAYVAVENIVTDRLHRWRPAVVFAFGLLHGLGFAGVLTEIGLPTGLFVTALVAFNVGVELGQLTVIACCFALVGWARQRPWYRRRVSIPGSVAIGLAGAWWLAGRVGSI